MMKKLIKPIYIAIFLWGLILNSISWFYPDYTRYYLILSIIVITPLAIIEMIKMKKEDKLNETTLFKEAIYRMLIMSVVLGVIFVITKQNHI
ncbi:hypothetical protein ASE21_12240 [Flavobacterium sp. Root901]|nr:hypothetical protein ASE21_12240 [Flavobacterium sp. Root901]